MTVPPGTTEGFWAIRASCIGAAHASELATLLRNVATVRGVGGGGSDLKVEPALAVDLRLKRSLQTLHELDLARNFDDDEESMPEILEVRNRAKRWCARADPASSHSDSLSPPRSSSSRARS